MKEIVVATTNTHKLAEIRQILTGWTIVAAADVGFHDEIEETGTTFMENALLKARAVCKATGLPALADDSGICVDALNGAPGVYSARYSGQGSIANRNLLLKEMIGKQNRTAHYTCAMALVFPDGRELTTQGEAYGHILTAPRGENGFSYDCLFFSDDLQKTFAEATEDEKNRVSHRGRALRQMLALLSKTNF